MKRKVSNPYAGIPAADRKHVRTLFHIQAAGGIKQSPADIYRSILKEREEKAKADAAEQARIEKENRRYKLERAQQDAAKALRTLMGAWNMAQAIEAQQDLEPAMNVQDMGAYVRMAIKEAGVQLEEALVAFDVLKPEQADAFRE
jgi:hypothetical protein